MAARAIRASTYIHNSAVIPFQGAFAGVFRIDNRARRMQLHVGHSDDGLAWRIDEAPTRFQCSTNPGRSSRGRIVVFVRDNARRG